MAKIGLISDTHNHLPEEALELLRGSDVIFHAGDICEPQILWRLETVAPVIAVLGNNDYADFGSTVHPIAHKKIEDVQFVVVHNPAHLKQAYEASNIDKDLPVVGIYGHKHVPTIDTCETNALFDLIVSPGSVFRSRESEGRRTVGFIEVTDRKVESVEIVDLLGNIVFSLNN